MADLNTTRRQLVGAMAALPIIGVVAIPAVSELDSLIRTQEALRDRLNSAPLTEFEAIEADYLVAVERLDRYRPTSAHEFVRALAARFEDGMLPSEANWFDLVGQARRIVGH